MSTTATNELDFEAALAELNQLIEKIEQGGLSLEDSLQKFERGMTLVNQCQQALKTAEQKVKILTTKNNTMTLEPYADLDSNTDE